MKKYTETLIIRVPKELKDKIQEKASKNYKDVSVYIRDIIIKDLKKE